MLNANEAYDRIVIDKSSELKYVQEAIMQAVAYGYSSCVYSEVIYPDTIEELKKAGYKISFVDNKCENSNHAINIDWSVIQAEYKDPVKCKKLHDKAKLPTYGSEFAAGADLYAAWEGEIERRSIRPHETIKIGTGLSFELPKGYFAAIFARSGLATKQGLRPANCVGVCDEDYRGEYIVALHNDTEEEQYIYNGDRIAQMVLLPYKQAKFEEVKELSDTERGSGGFGSTGTK